MKVLLGVLLLALASLCLAQSDIPPYKEFYFDQIIDHFNYQTAKLNQPQTFKQRYLMIDSNWDRSVPNPPIFFYSGNEGDITSFWNNTGFVFDIAPSFGAIVVFAEHRFYGKSFPYPVNEAFDLDHVGLLSIEQALADYAVLITSLKEQWGIPDSPVVTFGGSYGGMLSAWFRIKFPHVVTAALAASAPILVSSGFGSRPSFFETTTNDFAQANSQCPDIVRKGFSQALALAQQGPSGLKQLSAAFNLCKPLTSTAEVEHLILWVVNSFGSMAMTDYPYPTNFLAPLPAWPVKAACSILLDAAAEGQYLEGLAQAAGLFYNGTGGSLPCFDIWTEFIECADQTGCGTGPAGSAWDYQVCTEIIYFPNTNNVTDMFPPRNWTRGDLTNYCEKTWGVTPRMTWVATNFGAGNILASSNIIFSNGLLDPWHGGGFLKSLSDSLVAIVIEDGAHHLDLRGANPADPPSVVAARKQEVELISKWIGVTPKSRKY